MKRIIALLALFITMSAVAMAQVDNESIVEGDLEIEGLENIWIVVSLDKVAPQADFEPAKASGSNVAFLNHVRSFTINLVSLLFDKYAEEMYGMLGSNIKTDIDFIVTENGDIKVLAISGGATLGIDATIASKIFSSYRRWKPARYNKEPLATKRTLTIDLTL